MSRIDLAALRENANRNALGAYVQIAPDKLLALVEAAEALREVHEYHCGCDRPGNLAACICTPQSEFELLARFASRVPLSQPEVKA